MKGSMKTKQLKTGEAEVERLKKIIDAYEEHTSRTVIRGEITVSERDGEKMSFVITAPHFKDEDRFVQLVALQVASILRTIGVSGIKTGGEAVSDGATAPDTLPTEGV